MPRAIVPELETNRSDRRSIVVHVSDDDQRRSTRHVLERRTCRSRKCIGSRADQSRGVAQIGVPSGLAEAPLVRRGLAFLLDGGFRRSINVINEHAHGLVDARHGVLLITDAANDFFLVIGASGEFLLARFASVGRDVSVTSRPNHSERQQNACPAHKPNRTFHSS